MPQLRRHPHPLETSLVEWKQALQHLVRCGLDALETSLVEWKHLLLRVLLVEDFEPWKLP